jgi:hypothetical protein
MNPMTHVEAMAFATAGPFSFLDTFHTRATCLRIGSSQVTTAANCVEFEPGIYGCSPRLVVTTWV